jgi:hypothetical protein
VAFTSLVIEWFFQMHSISLIYQDQRGFAFFVMVNPGQRLWQSGNANTAHVANRVRATGG